MPHSASFSRPADPQHTAAGECSLSLRVRARLPAHAVPSGWPPCSPESLSRRAGRQRDVSCVPLLSRCAEWLTPTHSGGSSLLSAEKAMPDAKRATATCRRRSVCAAVMLLRPAAPSSLPCSTFMPRPELHFCGSPPRLAAKPFFAFLLLTESCFTYQTSSSHYTGHVFAYRPSLPAPARPGAPSPLLRDQAARRHRAAPPPRLWRQADHGVHVRAEACAASAVPAAAGARGELAAAPPTGDSAHVRPERRSAGAAGGCPQGGHLAVRRLGALREAVAHRHGAFSIYDSVLLTHHHLGACVVLHLLQQCTLPCGLFARTSPIPRTSTSRRAAAQRLRARL